MAKVVVFVDDSETVLMSAEFALQDMVDSGTLDMKRFNNPEDLISEVRNGFTYDLCITDINMPQMSGFELAANLKSLPSVKAKPIIALTTENSPTMKGEGKKVGLVGWLTKPFTKEKLEMAIKRILRIR